MMLSLSSRRRARPASPWVLFGVSALLLAGCAGVRPWERSMLAKRCMQINPDPTATALEQHVFEYREGAAGGYDAVGGSGCGCN